jgi:5-methylcytosine-specific restriction endonuclease McrA
MKIGLIIFIIVVLIVLNIYYYGKLLNKILMYKKYYKMIVIILIGLGIYLFINKNPTNYRDLVVNANTYLKYLPIDKNTQSILTPIIDLTSRSLQNKNNNFNSSYNNNNNNNNNNTINSLTPQQRKILTSGGRATKRSVSETKKKFVAANQNWCCKHCSKQLSAWFEVDHVTKLEFGGSNEVNNLEALCRECHGKKTALENL